MPGFKNNTDRKKVTAGRPCRTVDSEVEAQGPTSPYANIMDDGFVFPGEMLIPTAGGSAAPFECLPAFLPWWFGLPATTACGELAVFCLQSVSRRWQLYSANNIPLLSKLLQFFKD